MASQFRAMIPRENSLALGGALVAGPNLLHGLDVKRGKLPDVAIGAGHLVEATVARRAAGSFDELDFPPSHLHATLAEGNDQGGNGHDQR